MLYEQAKAYLGKDAYLNSKIVTVDRSDHSDVQRDIETPSGIVLIKSKKLIFTINPKLGNLQDWDLSHSEMTLFQQFGNSAYSTGLLRSTGIPNNASPVDNFGVGTIYNLPTLPRIYQVGQTSTLD